MSLSESTFAVLNDVKYLVPDLESPGKNMASLGFDFRTAAELTLVTDKFTHGASIFVKSIKNTE